MDNNVVLRQLRYIFDYGDDQMMDLFRSGGKPTNRKELSEWLKPEDDASFSNLSDEYLAAFLNGLINKKRGKKEGIQPDPEKELNNNIILRKLKIAMNLKVEEMVELYNIVGIVISKHEVNAFFRKPGQNQYRKCLDQYLRNFLFAMQKQYRDFKH
ncbi:YehS family protein [Portibacter marinus]|uniref:DUF1456 family protein n=1 Tax=Portibacter marinus TaxID=2898660 RepID=UPI001F19690B|nr:DUF1456 family protein [Portibacter marinus]